MPYIGKQPLTGAYQLCDTITTSATATYNLLVGGSAVIPGSAQNCIVSLNGVIQAPVNAFTVSGSTITFASTLSATDVIDFILILGNVFDIGKPTDGTVTPSSIQGGTSGLFTWQSVQTTGFTAVAGRAYPCNTTSAGFTVTLPATPSIGQQVLLLDYAGTADTNAITINPNGNKIEGGTGNVQLTGEREGVILTYIDSTQGWLATSGINEGTDALSPPSYSIDFLVIAGGGGGGFGAGGGGGGAGGYRTSTQTVTNGTVITVTVGDGGASAGTNTAVNGTSGSDSSISGSGLTTITSAGGGGGASTDLGLRNGVNGGSGGGGSGGNETLGGSGNTPSTSPSQGNNGGAGATGDAGNRPAGGGGGAGAVGVAGVTGTGGNGGAGTASSITGSSVTRAGGGGGGIGANGTSAGTGGTGGGGNGAKGGTSDSTAGTANTGGGGGGGSDYTSNRSASDGGKGVVILSVPTTKYSSTTTGSPTVTTSGSNTILQFNGTGSYTA